MRVIAGSARRLLLKTVEGRAVRPTSDQIKETLFNMLAPHIEQSYFLDLFAGSGAIGIEALSRGAKQAVFVEKDAKAVTCIQGNLLHTKLDNKAKLIKMDALFALRVLEIEGEHFDIIFMDPPYNKGLEELCLKQLEDSRLINASAMIIIEADINAELEFNKNVWKIDKEKKYKTNKHIYISRREK